MLIVHTKLFVKAYTCRNLESGTEYQIHTFSEQRNLHIELK